MHGTFSSIVIGRPMSSMTRRTDRWRPRSSLRSPSYIVEAVNQRKSCCVYIWWPNWCPFAFDSTTSKDARLGLDGNRGARPSSDTSGTLFNQVLLSVKVSAGARCRRLDDHVRRYQMALRSRAPETPLSHDICGDEVWRPSNVRAPFLVTQDL